MRDLRSACMWSVPLCLGMTRSISSSASIFSLGRSSPRAAAPRRGGIRAQVGWHGDAARGARPVPRAKRDAPGGCSRCGAAALRRVQDAEGVPRLRRPSVLDLFHPAVRSGSPRRSASRRRRRRSAGRPSRAGSPRSILSPDRQREDAGGVPLGHRPGDVLAAAGARRAAAACSTSRRSRRSRWTSSGTSASPIAGIATWPRSAAAKPSRPRPSRSGPATRRPPSARGSCATRPTSSSRHPSRSTCC